MTISNSITKKVYSGNGTSTVFTYNFYVRAAAELLIYIDVPGTGLVLKALTTDYTLTGLDNPAGGNVTFLVAPVTGVSNVLILRKTSLTQETDYIENDSFPAETHEKALDKLTLIVQELKEEIDRSVKIVANSTSTTDQLIASILTAESNSLINKNAAEAAAFAAALSYDSFDDRYLGAKAANPTLDNDGAALLTGALYFNTVSNEMRNYTGAAWLPFIAPADGSITTLKLVNLAVTNAKLADLYINDLPTVTFDAATDFVPIADASDSFNKKKALINTSKLQSIASSVAANALTLNYNGGTIDFRHTSLTNGTPLPLTIAANSIVVPSGATLGMVSAVAGRLYLLEAYNGGSPVACVTNSAGGAQLDETNLISPTTISAGATSANVIYSASAVAANSPYRIVGAFDIVETTAGTWAADATGKHGAGGQALTAMSSIGYGQTWQDVTGSRALSTTYYNTTGKPIQLSLRLVSTAGSTTESLVLAVNGVNLTGDRPPGTGAGYYFNMSGIIVPAGHSYQLTRANTTLEFWQELR